MIGWSIVFVDGVCYVSAARWVVACSETCEANMKRAIIATRIDGWGPAFAEDLRNRGFDVTVVETFEKMRDFLTQIEYDVALPTNNVNSKGSGMPELVSELRSKYPKLAIVIISAFADLRFAVDCTKRGVDDFIALPFETEDAINSISHALEKRASSSSE